MEVVTERNNTQYKWNQVVFEWEEDFVEELKGQLYYIKGSNQNKYVALINDFIYNAKAFKVDKQDLRIGFVMFVRDSYRYKKINSIPIYLDVHERWIDKIVQDTRMLDKYFVTSYDVYSSIHKKTNDNRCIYLPLSISNRYIDFSPEIDKTVDVVHLGRRDPALHEWMIRLINENPNIEYVYRGEDGSYVSSLNGKLGNLNTREEYMNLLRRAKVSLVSTPGVGTEKTFGNIDFITPRFYESTASYCHLIGRYIMNTECELLGIDKLCPNVNSYDMFKEKVYNALGTDNYKLVDEYRTFLHGNGAKKRAQVIYNELKGVGLL